MRKVCLLLSVMALLAGIVPAALAAQPTGDVAHSNEHNAPAKSYVATTEYVLLLAENATPAAARAAIRAAGGTIVRENAHVGMIVATSSNPNFAALLSKESSLQGVARNKSIGTAPRLQRPAMATRDLERLTAERAAARGTLKGEAPRGSSELNAEPLAHLQWNLDMIDATVDGSFRVEPGKPGVLVGVIDTGIDGSHPDIAPNFNAALSRNFTTDIPEIDGPCEEDPDGSCIDPADVDEGGHGTHVASTIASPINGLGIAGVAPGVTLVNLRAGQDSGYFFVDSVVEALTFAGVAGIDVVNMSFYIDPWLFNCTSNPADSAQAQIDQQVTIALVQRALNFAHRRGVTLIGSAGNNAIDLGYPTVDTSSPNYPAGSNYPRTIDNDDCLVLPTEGNHVLSITSVGPTGRKAYYSSYGIEQASVAAPGGDYRDFYGTEKYRKVGNLILAAYPQSLAELNGELNPDGTPNTPFVVRDCASNLCAYYQYLQGTSMASPHAAGVAALIVSRYGHRAAGTGGLTLNPNRVERILTGSATETPCPASNPYTYPDLPASYNATCEGTSAFNGFFGHGVINALRAVNPR